MLAVTACSDSDGGGEDIDASSSPAVSAEPTPADSPSASATATVSADLTFEEFAEQLDQALSDQSTAPFLADPILTDIECPNELMTDCGGAPTPTIISGVVIGRWRSEGFPVSPDEFEAELNDYLSTGPQLRAIAVKEVEGEDGTPAYYAITAVDGDPESTAYFIFKEDDGAFRLQALIFAPVLGDEWLLGECGECYDQWEPR